MNQIVPATPSPPIWLYKYQMIRKIGQGVFGEVWLARDATLQREFAVKVLNPGLSVDLRLREAQIGNRLSHNNLVHIHHADVANANGVEVVILAMDYLPNGSIETLANPSGYLPLPDIIRIAKDILQGLDHLHAKNFFHNDIKPGNILLGPQRQAMLSDYGITGVSSNGAPVAAPNFYRPHRAPEVTSTGNVGVSSDIFQVGMTLARLALGLNHLNAILASKGPLQYDQEIAAGKLITSGDFPSHIPGALRRIILKAVHSDPAQRFSSALEMRRTLERLDFPGYWTVDAAGNEIGISGGWQFSYSKTAASAGTFDVVCTGTKAASGKCQRVMQFCQKGLSAKAATKLVDDFKRFVVEGT